MQSEPKVPFNTSLFDVPRMTFVPAGQQLASSASTTVTRWVAVAVLPPTSVADHRTTVVPGVNFSGASLVMDTEPQPSVATGVPRAGCAHLVVTISSGTEVKTGGVRSS